jgi:serine/threonine protein kinase
MNPQQRYEIIGPRGGHHEGTSIGEGAYGVVFKAFDRMTNTPVAIKKIRLETENDGISPSTVREITLLMQLNHENVVKLLNVVMDKERMSLVFELLDTDLKKYMDNRAEPLPLETIRVIFYNLLIFQLISLINTLFS